MTVLDHARKLVADCDEELHFERRVKRALKCLIAEIERLESELESIGAGGVGPLMPIANSPEIPDSSDQGGQHLDMVQAGWKLVPVKPTRDMLTKWIKAVVVSNTTAPDLYQAMLAAAPQPPAVKDSLTVEQEPVAFMHDVVASDGEPDQALSFSKDNFPLEGLGGFRSIGIRPLYTHPQNLRCKSNQKRLATLCGYVKAEPPNVEQVPSPTAGMNIAQRILHVGGRNNAAGYVEFGGIQAVEALVLQVLRDLPRQHEPQVEQEPALVVAYDKQGWRQMLDDMREIPDGTSLYTHPQPKREPLNPERIETGWDNEDVAPTDSPESLFEAGVRFAERAHGIGGEA
jgi:hypothetical protein